MEDLELPPELAGDTAGAPGPSADAAFVAPSPGAPAAQRWLDRRTQLAAEHAAAGEFGGAMSLLHRQLGAASFEPLRPFFLELYAASHASLPGLQGVPSVVVGVDRAWSKVGGLRLEAFTQGRQGACNLVCCDGGASCGPCCSGRQVKAADATVAMLNDFALTLQT